MATTIAIVEDGTVVAQVPLRGTKLKVRASIKNVALLEGIPVDGASHVSEEGVPVPGTPMTPQEVGIALLSLWLERAKQLLVSDKLEGEVEPLREAARQRLISESDL